MLRTVGGAALLAIVIRIPGTHDLIPTRSPTVLRTLSGRRIGLAGWWLRIGEGIMVRAGKYDITIDHRKD